VGFALAGSVWLAAGAWLAAGLLRSAAAPLLETWLVAVTDPATRATALSVVGQADSAGQILGGPPVGVLGSRTSVPVALLATGLVGLPALVLLGRARTRSPVAGPPVPSRPGPASR
jgi:MFS transporter, DHA3 family, tetracycline resistance protein